MTLTTTGTTQEPRPVSFGLLGLPLLVLLLPFEPTSPVLALLGTEVTLLELGAAVIVPLCLFGSRGQVLSLVRRPPLPLAMLGAYVSAHALSAAFAEGHRALAVRFVLRMGVAAAFAAAVALAPFEARRQSLVALVVAALIVAFLAVLEGWGFRGLDPWLDLFRVRAFLAGGVRRATAGSWNPNLAAAFLSAGLLAGVALSLDRPRATLLLSLPLAAGLLSTYSRGALGATVVGLAALLLALGRRSRAPAVALAALLVVAAVFAAARPTLWLRLTVESAGLRYGARYTAAERHLVLAPGQPMEAVVSILNTGETTWIADRFGLLARWYDPTSRAEVEGPLVRLPRAVRPGENVEVRLPVRAPAAEGRHVLVLDLFERSRGLFSTYGVPPAAIAVSVAREGIPPPFRFDPPPEVWRRGRWELWRIAALLWRERPLLGVGPDNYRWLHAARGGWLVAGDFARTADNTYLEIAATTGALGLLAYLGTLLATARSGWRSLSASPASPAAAAVLGIVVMMAAHGAVEYVLRFTGHYLLFGLIVGLASPGEPLSPETAR